MSMGAQRLPIALKLPAGEMQQVSRYQGHPHVPELRQDPDPQYVRIGLPGARLDLVVRQPRLLHVSCMLKVLSELVRTGLSTSPILRQHQGEYSLATIGAVKLSHLDC